MARQSAEWLHRNVVYPHLISGKAREDREIAHERALNYLDWIDSHEVVRNKLSEIFTYKDPILETKVNGIQFPNPLGVAAGLDKNARVFRALAAFGFGHVEVGSITRESYEGNPRPRVFALPQDKAFINRMGFPGDGVWRSYDKLKEKLVPRRDRDYVVGVNIGASRPSFERGSQLEDYVTAMKLILFTECDYFVLNLSSPNTSGVRGLQEPQILDQLLSMSLRATRLVKKPLLIKISPDVPNEQLDGILDVAMRRQAQGIIVTNTSTNPDLRSQLKSDHREETGGISGRPLTTRALEMSRYIYTHTEGKLPIIRAGGVMDVMDYWEAISYGGADLVQVYSATVDQTTSTPNLAYNFNKGLATLMRSRGIKSIQELKGSNVR
ncbi:quinone-dependent dihydroorotate dehydrogenase [Candidatus Microgenomates bacterium]|nr:quinone-dependent dihydroorotate dehydrogenase [Candidatus Microgenomates bacterium]